MNLPLIPQPPMHVIVPGDPVEDVPCDHERTVTNQRLCSPGEVRCVDCGRAVDPDAPPTTEAHAAVPDLHYYRLDPTDECDHGATLTFRSCLLGGHPVTFDQPLTYCFDCHHLAPTPQEDPQP